jgi:LIM domain-binding protein 2
MQELMSRHKAYALSPRDCLKTTLFQKWQRMVAPPGTYKLLPCCNRIFLIKYGRLSILNANLASTETQRPPNKRRKRKGSQTGGGAGGGIGGNPGPGAPAVPNNKKRSPGPNFSLASQVSNGTGKVLISFIQHFTTNTQIVHTNT